MKAIKKNSAIFDFINIFERNQPYVKFASGSGWDDDVLSG